MREINRLEKERNKKNRKPLEKGNLLSSQLIRKQIFVFVHSFVQKAGFTSGFDLSLLGVPTPS